MLSSLLIDSIKLKFDGQIVHALLTKRLGEVIA